MRDTTIWGEERQTPLEVSQATPALPSLSKTKDAGMVNVVAGNLLPNDKLVFYEGLNQGG